MQKNKMVFGWNPIDFLCDYIMFHLFCASKIFERK